jgi:hypothetical protein
MAEMETTQQFIDALQALERDRDPTEMTDLFMENSEVGNIVSHRTFIGKAPANSGRRTGTPSVR